MSAAPSPSSAAITAATTAATTGASAGGGAAVTAEAMLEVLQRWRQAAQLRALDLAFVRLLHELDGEAPASLLLAGALAAQMEGRGHDCIELAPLTREQAAGVIGWTSPSIDELLALLPDWDAERARWAASPLIELDPPTAWGQQAAALARPSAPGRAISPLVLHQGRLYLRRYWTWESRVAAQVRARTAAVPQAKAEAEAVDAAAARRWLDQLFPPAPSRRGTAQTAKGAAPPLDGQKLACALALQGRFTVITGGPGTGKTYTAARLLVLLQALHQGRHPLRVALAAPTGKAAARLRQAIDGALAQLRPTIARDLFEHDPTAPPGAARTLHALLGARPGTRRFRHDASHPLEVDVLFVDEASMVHLEMMDALLDALPPHARLVLLGDKDQLASVEAGAVLGDLCAGAGTEHYNAATRQHVQAVAGIVLPEAPEGTGPRPGPDATEGDGGRTPTPLSQHVALLHTSHRFGGAIGELARAVNRGDTAAVRTLLAGGHGAFEGTAVVTTANASSAAAAATTAAPVATPGEPAAATTARAAQPDVGVRHLPEVREGTALGALAVDSSDGTVPG